uniref:non-specific serine/threonine protein kinase n=1 Tax=Latimeria chalumnae TaxID=7897 RepID=H3BBZ1_LATCH
MVIMSDCTQVPASNHPQHRPLRVGFYDIEKTLGKGNFAVVKLARHRVTKTQVAIKIIDKTRLDPVNLEKIYREVQIMKLLNHPHIIKLYQVMETKDMLYIVTEYAKNGEMFGILNSDMHMQKFQQQRQQNYVVELHYYEQIELNVFTSSRSNFSLIIKDFGFGNFYKSGEPLSTWCGSPPYAAPEVFEGREYEGPQLDIWSLGVVLYVLVCGSLPFDGPTLPVLRQRVLEGRFRIPYFMSQDCENLIRRMLVVDPAKRINIAQIKQHRWIQADPSLPQQVQPFSMENYNSNLGDYNEQVLGIMQTLGIDRQRTTESLQNSSYNHFAAIYYLLLERVKEHRNSQLKNRQLTTRQQRPKSSEVIPTEMPQEALVADCLRSPLYYQQPQNLLQSSFQTDVDCDSNSLFQPILFPVDPAFTGLFRNRSISPNSLLETTISEEVRQDKDLEEELMLSRNPTHLPNNTSRRHTLAEVTTHFHQCATPCIVISSSTSPTEGTSSDSCLTSSSNDWSFPAMACQVDQAMSSSNQATDRMTPPFLNTQSATQVLQVQGCMGGATLLPVNFQEGRRASDTSLTQGLKAFRQHLRKNARAKGFLGLNKIKGFARQVCQSPSTGASRNGLPHLQHPQANTGVFNSGGNREGRSLLEEVLHQQRMLQLQHQQAVQSSNPQASLFVPSPTAIVPCKQSSNSLLLAELQRENSFELVFGGTSPVHQPHSHHHPPLFGTSVSPVSSAAQLFGAQLCLDRNGPPTGCTFPQQTGFSFQPQSCELLTSQQTDCEMEDLTSAHLGKFVLVK